MHKSNIVQHERGIKNLVNEIKVHWALNRCDNILQLLEIFEDFEFVYLVLEYQPKGTLLDLIEQKDYISETTTRVILEQILLGLDFFHNKKIIHRDIKLENVLISAIEEETHYDIRIADFGLAIFTLLDEMLEHRCGSPGYVAPEILRGHPYSYKADIFGAGAVLFNLLSRRYLFSGKDGDEVLRRNARCSIDHVRKYLTHVSPAGQELMFWMLEADPERRPTAKEAL
jgi:serine/threonine protein kinase